jgi:hypothetical protein
MPFVKGYLKAIVSPGGPDNSLPGIEGPVDPDYGIGIERPDNSLPYPPGPVDPGYGYPLPPIVSHPIAPGGGSPSHPIAPPTYPVDPSYGLPLPPTVWPNPPVFPNHDLPVAPVVPTHPIYRPVAPNNDLPLPPGAVWPPLPPYVSTGQLMCFIWIPGIGYRWTTIDTSLKPSHPIVIPPSTVPGVPTHPIAGTDLGPDQTLPPTQAQPKR